MIIINIDHFKIMEPNITVTLHEMKKKSRIMELEMQLMCCFEEETTPVKQTAHDSLLRRSTISEKAEWELKEWSELKRRASHIHQEMSGLLQKYQDSLHVYEHSRSIVNQQVFELQTLCYDDFWSTLKRDLRKVQTRINILQNT